MRVHGARYYSPEIGRFVQPDSMLPDMYDPQQLNRYAYVRNNPLKYVDPTGHYAEIMIRHASLGGVIVQDPGHAMINIDGTYYGLSPDKYTNADGSVHNVEILNGDQFNSKYEGTTWTGFTLNLTEEQEAKIVEYWQKQTQPMEIENIYTHDVMEGAIPQFDILLNNCGKNLLLSLQYAGVEEFETLSWKIETLAGIPSSIKIKLNEIKIMEDIKNFFNKKYKKSIEEKKDYKIEDKGNSNKKK